MRVLMDGLSHEEGQLVGVLAGCGHADRSGPTERREFIN